ncbi:ROK family protein [Pediococcus siamensis]|uniref:ROK family protein n=1 Tax=Pediococcus siamensis TaxID=381829 RepID=UPI0039A167B8
MAALILNIQSILDIQRVIISGGISNQPLVLTTIQQAYRKIFTTVPLIRNQLTPVPILEAHFQNNANLYGAVYNLLLQEDLQNS